MTKEWEDKTDNSLERIEGQSDGSEKQGGYALNFRETVLTSLTKIEGTLDQNSKDIVTIKADLKICTEKIPQMELGLNNHLTAHAGFRKGVYYPILVGIGLAGLATFFKLVLHIF